MDAKTDAMQAEIDSARAANLITDAKADSLAVELTKVQPSIDSAKANSTVPKCISTKNCRSYRNMKPATISSPITI